MSEIAPEYTKKERIIVLLKVVSWCLPLYILAEFWFFDWLSGYAENANCYKYGSVNGVHFLMYGVFTLMPLSLAVILFLFEGRRSIKILKLGQNPLPGEKVFRPTRYKYGNSAKVQPVIVLVALVFIVGMSVWGGFQAHEITKEVKPCLTPMKLKAANKAVQLGHTSEVVCFVLV